MENQFWLLESEERLLETTSEDLLRVYSELTGDGSRENGEAGKASCYSSCWCGNLYHQGYFKVVFGKNSRAALTPWVTDLELAKTGRVKDWKVYWRYWQWGCAPTGPFLADTSQYL